MASSCGAQRMGGPTGRCAPCAGAPNSWRSTCHGPGYWKPAPPPNLTQPAETNHPPRLALLCSYEFEEHPGVCQAMEHASRCFLFDTGDVELEPEEEGGKLCAR